MDPNNLIPSAVTAGIVSIIYALYKVFKHSSCISDCCGRVTTVKVDLSPGSFPAAAVPGDLKNTTPRPSVQTQNTSSV